MEPTATSPPPARTRLTGTVYLLYFVTAIVAVALAKGIVRPDDAAATARNLLAQVSWYRAGFAVGLVANALYVALTVLLYRLFKPVDAAISSIAALISLAGCIVQVAASVLALAPLVLLGNGGNDGAFTPAQSEAAALLFLKLHAQSFHIALVFFALYDLLLGWLVVRSTFVPRVFGIVLILAGIAWLANLWPPLAVALAVYIQPFGFLAEFVFMLWLLVRGVPAASSGIEPRAL